MRAAGRFMHTTAPLGFQSEITYTRSRQWFGGNPMLRAHVLLSFLILATALGSCIRPAAETVLVVNTHIDAIDANPGDGLCDTGETVLVDGEETAVCSLRAAIDEINAQPEGVKYQVKLAAPVRHYELDHDLRSHPIRIGDSDRTLGRRKGLHLVGDRQVSITSGARKDLAPIISAKADTEGRLFTVWGADLAIQGVTLVRGNARGGNDRTNIYGGAVLVDGAGTLFLWGCELTNNRAALGGAVAFMSQPGSDWISYEPGDERFDKTSRIVDTRFHQNTANRGGAVYVDWSRDLIVGLSEFEDNRASRTGGAIDIESRGSEIKFEKTKFFFNVARSGGAINATFPRGLNLIVQNSIFMGNEAYFFPFIQGVPINDGPGKSPDEGGHGAALQIQRAPTGPSGELPPILDNASAVVIHSTFYKNFSERGGAIANWTELDINIDATLLAYNYRTNLRVLNDEVRPIGSPPVLPWPTNLDSILSHCRGKIRFGRYNWAVPSFESPDCEMEFEGTGNIRRNTVPPFGRDIDLSADIWSSMRALRDISFQLSPRVAAIDALENCDWTDRDAYGAIRPKDGDGDGNAKCDIGATERSALAQEK